MERVDLGDSMLAQPHGFAVYASLVSATSTKGDDAGRVTDGSPACR